MKRSSDDHQLAFDSEMEPHKRSSDHHHHQPKPHSDHRHHAPEDNNGAYCKRGLLLLVIPVALFLNITVLDLVFRQYNVWSFFNGFSPVIPGIPPKEDKLLGGLLLPGFDEKSCLSRYESVLYLKELKRQPSSSLISKLRSYEALHKRCGPYTESYNKTVELIKSGERPFPDTGCKYVIWIPFNGLGNKILSLTTAFLYAIVTNRTVLASPMDHVPELFCEPFPGTSLFLPEDFPVAGEFNGFDQNSKHCYGNIVKNKLIDRSDVSQLPPFVYNNLFHNKDRYDELFFQDEHQMFLQKIPWLIIKTDEYFIPSLFEIPSFQKVLENMFPDRESVFHLLARYLFHPTNPVWEMITRYHDAYLTGADEKIGLQVRVFDGPGPFQHVLDQILGCTMKENILPQIINNPKDPNINSSRKNKTKVVVLMTSLSSWYADRIRDMYLQHPTLNGEVVRVHQPSHEEEQKWSEILHYSKALAEIYLLGMSDRLVTSGCSTFGYVAQGFGGLHSWLMFEPKNRKVPDPPCIRVTSMDPCYLIRPADTSKAALVPYAKPCEDRSIGLKLVPVNKTTF
ncbi:PREDICTED: galactoside 2-alpha-L-fucosyltransferase-like isoform X2 [Ipomoea nil]|uniref:galactoside 2-alpha-L-fucosyltransferase-like isoform X2 n=1 Tax=Ipomoea nil TaxID=35883 RepID=UPI0009015F85|nr:PREDICTED: galactoside 2-alpha-L-fucosyltransferase-like isoform X2 [Ipomoea nil]